MKTHPLALQTRAQINLYTKGRQAGIIQDSLLLIKQAAPQLGKGEAVLYINTLTSHATIENVADKLTARYGREICTFSASSRNMMQRLEFLEHTITARNIKLLILNSFEFAAVFSRQRSSLATWLREMRDAHGVRVAVYSMHPQQPNGALATLAWLADRVEQVSDWKFDEDISSSLNVQENPEAAVEEFSFKLDQDPQDTRDASFFVDRPGALNFRSMAEILRPQTLKNNDLASEVTRPQPTQTSRSIQPTHEEIDEEMLEMA